MCDRQWRFHYIKKLYEAMFEVNAERNDPIEAATHHKYDHRRVGFIGVNEE